MTPEREPWELILDEFGFGHRATFRHIDMATALAAARAEAAATPSVDEAYWRLPQLLRGPGTDQQALDHIVARMQDLFRGPEGFRAALAACAPDAPRLPEHHATTTLYLFEQGGECTGFVRDPQGRILRTCEDELPDAISEDAPHGVLLVWDGERLDPRTMTAEECDAKGIPFDASRGCETWWQGAMRPATDAEVLAVLARAPNVTTTTRG